MKGTGFVGRAIAAGWFYGKERVCQSNGGRVSGGAKPNRHTSLQSTHIGDGARSKKMHVIPYWHSLRAIRGRHCSSHLAASKMTGRKSRLTGGAHRVSRQQDEEGLAVAVHNEILYKDGLLSDKRLTLKPEGFQLLLAHTLPPLCASSAF